MWPFFKSHNALCAVVLLAARSALQSLRTPPGPIAGWGATKATRQAAAATAQCMGRETVAMAVRSILDETSGSGRRCTDRAGPKPGAGRTIVASDQGDK